jgi:flagellar biosynthetic protein FliQ
MNSALIIELSRDVFYTAMLVALPALAVSLIVGLLASIFRTVIRIQEQTLSNVPRIMLVGLAIVLTMVFTFDIAVAFTRRMVMHAAGAAL